MRIAASIVGIVGALCGIFFAQLVLSVGMMLAIVTSATQGGEMELGTEFYLGLLALVVYAVGVAAAVTVATRPIIGALLLLMAAVGSLVTTIAINGAPSAQTGGAFIAVVPASTPPVSPSRARLASAVPMPLHAQPAASAPTTIEIAPGTAFESYEQEGEFVHVRGEDFDGYLPAWSIRRAS